MSEQDYSWAHIAGQVDALMRPYQALEALRDMLNKASQVEAYLAQHAQKMEQLEAACEKAREELSTTAQEYVDLQKIIADEKAAHEEDMKCAYKASGDFKRELDRSNREMQAAHDGMKKKLAEELAELRGAAAEERAQIVAAIQEEEERLAAVKEALAALKEKL